MYTDIYGNKFYKVGLHIHTTLSDGRKSPEEVAKIYKDAGFDAIAITDHWKYHEKDVIADLPIISGCEYNMGASDTSVDVMHIVGVGMEREPNLTRGKCTRQDVIDEIRRCGGLAILAHPAWSLNSPQHAKELSGFEAVEIYNTVSNVNQSSRPYSGYFVDLMANDGIDYPIIATDDAHYYNGEDETISYVMVRSEDCSTKSILDAIRHKDFYATQGPELHVRREGNKMIVDCSECVMIDFLSNSAWCPDRIVRGKGLTHAEYELKTHEKWVRVEVHDENGKYAWSNVFWVK